MRLKRHWFGQFRLEHQPINEKNLKSEIETACPADFGCRLLAINEKNLKSEIETRTAGGQGARKYLPINEKNLKSEIETDCRAYKAIRA